MAGSSYTVRKLVGRQWCLEAVQTKQVVYVVGKEVEDEFLNSVAAV